MLSDKELALNYVDELGRLISEQKKELIEYCEGKKKYNDIYESLSQLTMKEEQGFLDKVQKDIKKNKYNKDNQFIIAVYLARYSSLFYHLTISSETKEEEIKSKYKLLIEIPSQVEYYLEELKSSQ